MIEAKPTPIWESRGREKRSAVQSMFADIAESYDRVNRLMSFNQDRRWREVAVELVSPKNGDTALDVCSGTGDFLSILRDKVGVEGAACGIDFCSPMLECAAEKGIDKLAQGDAVQLPVQDGVADVVTVGWGIRNVPDIDLAHQEIARVLKSGGRFVSVDMAVPRNPLIRLASRFIAKRVLPLIGNMFGARQAYTYLPESTERFLDRDELAHSMRKAGFVHVQYRDFMLGNICLHTGTKP